MISYEMTLVWNMVESRSSTVTVPFLGTQLDSGPVRLLVNGGLIEFVLLAALIAAAEEEVEDDDDDDGPNDVAVGSGALPVDNRVDLLNAQGIG